MQEQKKIGQYVIDKTLGQGTFGKVKLGIHMKTGQRVAIKMLQKKKIVDVADIERVSREIHILRLIRHPNLIQLYEIIETAKYLFLVMEYCPGGELFDYIAQCQKVSEKQACRFLHDILDGVDYLHQLSIVHRDLKPQNMLLDAKNRIKIVDFGLSNTYTLLHEDPHSPILVQQSLKTACGSPCYAAPQMIAGKKYNGLQVDLWSCGVILYAMLCGSLPFEDSNTSILYKKIMTLNYTLPEELSSSAKHILKGLLAPFAKRFTLSQIRASPFYQLCDAAPTPGILIGKHVIPLDPNILAQVTQLGYDGDITRQCLQTNKHNSATTAYYLLLKEKNLQGFHSFADMNSDRFDPTLLKGSQRKQLCVRKSSMDRLLEAEVRENTYYGHKRKGSLGVVRYRIKSREAYSQDKSAAEKTMYGISAQEEKRQSLEEKRQSLEKRTHRYDHDRRKANPIDLPLVMGKSQMKKVYLNYK